MVRGHSDQTSLCLGSFSFFLTFLSMRTTHACAVQRMLRNDAEPGYGMQIFHADDYKHRQAPGSFPRSRASQECARGRLSTGCVGADTAQVYILTA